MRALRLAVLFILAIGQTVAAEPMGSREFEAYLERLQATFLSVWDNEIKAGIDMVPAYAGKADDLPLEWKQCQIRPGYRRLEKDIVMDAGLIPLQIYLQQVVLFYVIGSDQVATPEQVDGYARSLRAVIAARKQSCDEDRKRRPWPLEAIVGASYFNGWGDRYQPVLDFAARQPRAQELGDLLGGLPAFFVVLHETGHHSFRSMPPEDGDEEQRADAFAATVLHANQLPVTSALPFLRLYGDDDSKDVPCRMLRLAEMDEGIAAMMSDYPVAYGERLIHLRDYYLGQLGSACD